MASFGRQLWWMHSLSYEEIRNGRRFTRVGRRRRTPLSLQTTGDRSYSGNQSHRAAAMSGAIDQSTFYPATDIPIAAHWSVASNRHRHSAPTTSKVQYP